MVTDNETSKTSIPFSVPATFSEALTRGVEIPKELRKFYWGFDFEIQLSNIDNRIIDYLNTAFEEITALTIRRVDINNGKYSSSETDWFDNEINSINAEVKVIIRAHRGKDGFTVRESKTFRTEAEQTLEDRSEQRKGLIKGLLGR